MDKQFYFGTSTKTVIGDWLVPMGTINWRKVKRISVTDSLDSAIFYAKKKSDLDGGSPIVYLVEPELTNLIQKNATDYITTKAKIIKTVDISEKIS